MMSERDLSLWKSHPNRSKSYFLDDGFLQQLKSASENSYENDFQDLNIFNFDQIFICVNVYDSHWVLIRILMKIRKIECFDSITPSLKTMKLHNINMGKISEWLLYEQLYHDKGKTKLCNHEKSMTWQTEIVKNNLKQDDGYNCGIHMLLASYFLSDFENFDSYDKMIIDNGRLKIAVDLYKGFIEDPRITDINDYHYSYKSIQFQDISEVTKQCLQTPNDPECLIDCRDKIIKYFHIPYDEEMEKILDVEDSEFFPSTEETNKMIPFGDDLFMGESIKKSKKRKICPLSAFHTLQHENEMLKQANGIYKQIFHTIYEQETEKDKTTAIVPNSTSSSSQKGNYNNKKSRVEEEEFKERTLRKEEELKKWEADLSRREKILEQQMMKEK
jgi:hypothetical protein